MVTALGLGGVLVPGAPGPWLVWAAVLWWALTDPRPVAWAVLVGATGVLLLTLVVRWALPPRRLRAAGATPGMAGYAGTGAVIGFVLLPVLGALPGFLAASTCTSGGGSAGTARRCRRCARPCGRAAPACSPSRSPVC